METAGVYRATVRVQMYMCQMWMYIHTCIVKGWSLQYTLNLELWLGHCPKTAFDIAQLSVTLWPWQKYAVTVRRFGRIWRNKVSHKYSTLLQFRSQLSLWYFFEWPLLECDVSCRSQRRSLENEQGHERRQEESADQSYVLNYKCVLEMDVCA